MKLSTRFLLPLILLGACHKAPPASVYQAVAVEKRDISVTASASGAINPDTTVQVKSKASGEILDIKVQTGDFVKHGTLIVQVDQRIPANDVAQAVASLQVDSAQLENAKSQLTREKELYAAKAVTQQEFETSQLAVAVANAALVRDEITYENAKIALGDTQVLSPISGTVISLAVQRGTVISSPTSSASGGTVILTMADLSLMHVVTWVDETDVGKLHPGQIANVSVAAYPSHPFRGQVLKIEPQADTIQNVTMFPVDIRIDNKDNLLKPGMNADVSISVGQRLGVLAVPNAALRTERDVASAGMVLGIAPDALQTMLADAKKTFTNETTAHSDTTVQNSLPAPGADSTKGAAGRGGRRNGGDSSRGGNKSAAPAGAAGSNSGNGGGNGGGSGGGRGGRGGRAGNSDYTAGGKYIVFTTRNGKPTPVYIQTGLTDLDYSEVKVGLVAGDSVLLLPSASLINQQQAMQQRMSANSGLPGQAKAAPTPAAGGGRSGGGGRP